jgi:hypothetical protein
MLNPGEAIAASVVFTYTGGVPLPDGGEQLFDVHADANGNPIGGFHKVFGPPLKLHLRPEPVFAESEISVSPYPIPPGEPAEICVEVRNVTHQPRQGLVTFRAPRHCLPRADRPAGRDSSLRWGCATCVHWYSGGGSRSR